MKKLTHITLHGILSEQIGRQNFNLAVSNVGEAMRGIQANCKKLYKSLVENDEKNIKYRVLINKKDLAICPLHGWELNLKTLKYNDSMVCKEKVDFKINKKNEIEFYANEYILKENYEKK